MRAPTNPVLVNYVGTGVLDRPLTQQNLRMVREAHPYAHRVRLCEIKDHYKPEFVGMFPLLCNIKGAVFFTAPKSFFNSLSDVPLVFFKQSFRFCVCATENFSHNTYHPSAELLVCRLEIYHHIFINATAFYHRCS